MDGKVSWPQSSTSKQHKINTKYLTWIKGTVSSELIARRWNIGLKVATNTYNSMTHLGVRDYANSIGTRRLKHMAYQLKHRCLCCAMYTNTLFSELKSLAQNTCGQIFTTEFHWTCFYLL